MRIQTVSARQAAVQDLIALHLQGMHASSPPGHVFALDLTGYEKPGLTLWGAFIGDALAGMVALQRIGAADGEIKSMRTHPDFLRRGVARALLEHLIVAARADGFARLSLETGSGDMFESALALYRARGFENGAAFDDYEASAFNQFLHLDLD